MIIQQRNTKARKQYHSTYSFLIPLIPITGLDLNLPQNHLLAD